MDIGQAEVTALKLIGQALVIDAQKMQDCGIEIMNVDRIFNDVVAKIVRTAVGRAGVDSGPGHENGEAPTVMVATIIILGEGTL